MGETLHVNLVAAYEMPAKGMQVAAFLEKATNVYMAAF